MRIVTQNNDKSIEFDGTEITLQYNSVLYQNGNSKGKLGGYETGERALEVFEEMHKQWFENCMSVYKMPEA